MKRARAKENQKRQLNVLETATVESGLLPELIKALVEYNEKRSM